MKKLIKIVGIGSILLGLGFCIGAEEENLIQITASEMKYSEKELHLYKNVEYQFRFKNEGNMLHDWNVKEMPVKIVSTKQSANHHHSHSSKDTALHIASEAKSDSEIRFQILKAGTYEYYCSVPGHKEAGMKGKILVH